MTRKILEDVRNERIYQNRKWGGREHDRLHTSSEWKQIIADCLQETRIQSTEEYRLTLVKVAAVALAALEAFDEGQGVRRPWIRL
jgi:hypothetical protein